ncbi:MAG: hypothetical protein ACO3O0_00580, partial [Bacteroidia bacterium]
RSFTYYHPVIHKQKGSVGFQVKISFTIVRVDAIQNPSINNIQAHWLTFSITDAGVYQEKGGIRQ